jgi:HD-GYP domain-containing protein (c-di-GMP phosphodiesterase class II)
LNAEEAKRRVVEGIKAVQVIAEGYELYIWSALMLVAVVSLAFAAMHRTTARRSRNALLQARRALQSVHPAKSVEHNLNALLEVVGDTVEAASYAFYTYDERNKAYILKAVRHRAENFGKIKPSYSGLKPYGKETYMAPLSFPSAGATKETALIKEGDVPLLQVPIGETLGVVRIGPVGGRLHKRVKRMMDDLGDYMKTGLHFMLDKEKATTQAEVVISSGRALQQISHIALDPNVTVELMLQLSMRTLGASSGCFVRKNGDSFEMLATSGIEKELERTMKEDPDLFRQLHGLLRQGPHAALRRGDEAFYRLPPYMAATGMERLDIIQADGPSQFLLYWYEGASDDSARQFGGVATLHMIMEDMRALVGYQTSLRQLSSTYTNILKKLSQLLDNLSPYTVGYSEQMSRYSIVIGQEMGLPEDVIRDIALAAYLSNIGVLGISTELYQKEGKYTDKEFELMKLHAEVGASIVKTTTGNERAASYIMHHHERMDGNGYPSALKGHEIPIGAKIIAVVQTFLAKINGRQYRDPLSFSQALKTLVSASGMQLDPDVVRVFIDWIKTKQADPKFNAKALGSCWEMSCTPSSICEHCPAFGRTDVNCWDVQGNNCRAHGKQCETCFVRTEVATRKEVAAL